MNHNKIGPSKYLSFMHPQYTCMVHALHPPAVAIHVHVHVSILTHGGSMAGLWRIDYQGPPLIQLLASFLSGK